MLYSCRKSVAPTHQHTHAPGTPTISKVTPSYAFERGRQVITVTGSNFYASDLAACVFNGTKSTAATVLSSTTLQCESPRIALDGLNVTASISFAIALEANRCASPQMFAIFGASLSRLCQLWLLVGLSALTRCCCAPTL